MKTYTKRLRGRWTVSLYLWKTYWGLVCWHMPHDPSTQESEAGRLWVQNQPGCLYVIHIWKWKYGSSQMQSDSIYNTKHKAFRFVPGVCTYVSFQGDRSPPNLSHPPPKKPSLCRNIIRCLVVQAKGQALSSTEPKTQPSLDFSKEYSVAFRGFSEMSVTLGRFRSMSRVDVSSVRVWR